jgi:TPR repeat protein
VKKLVLLIALLGAGLAQAAPCVEPGAAQEAHRLGLKYRNGAGVAPDAVLALHFLKQAADCRLPAAMFLLANMLAAGEGAPVDAAQARHWLEAAAALDYPEALQQLALIEPDPRKAELLMRQAAHALQHR